jgi:hypothetical protein
MLHIQKHSISIRETRVSEQNLGQNRTIKQLADEARARAIAHYGEAAFAKMCLEFDQSIMTGPAGWRKIPKARLPAFLEK